MKVLINDGSDWKTFRVLLKPGRRLIKSHQIGWTRSQISRDAMRSDSCWLLSSWALV